MFSLTQLERNPKNGRLGINTSDNLFENIYISKHIDLSIQADPNSYCEPRRYIQPHAYKSYEIAFIYVSNNNNNNRCFYPKLTPTYMYKYMEETNSNVDGIFMYVPYYVIEQLVRDMRLLYSDYKSVPKTDEKTHEKTDEKTHEKTDEKTDEKTPTPVIKKESDWYIVTNNDYK